MQPCDTLTLEDEHERNWRVRINKLEDLFYWGIQTRAHPKPRSVHIFMQCKTDAAYVCICCLSAPVINCVILQGWIIMNEAPGSHVWESRSIMNFTGSLARSQVE